MSPFILKIYTEKEAGREEDWDRGRTTDDGAEVRRRLTGGGGRRTGLDFEFRNEEGGRSEELKPEAEVWGEVLEFGMGNERGRKPEGRALYLL